MRTIIDLAGVQKSFPKGREVVDVLAGIDLRVSAGEFLALMGPSGSGKTTLLNIIGGIDRASAGQVSVANQDLGVIERDGELARWRAANIGFVFQFYNLLPVLTALGNVELPLLLTKLPPKKRRGNAETALAVVGLQDRADHKPGQLSGGQQQRVAIARAIVADPPILVCDEPTGDLDRDTAEEILELLDILCRQHGKTIVMVTHDPKAASHAQRVAYLDKGRLSEEAA